MPETLGGLPLHPLVVHAVVVLLPLSAVGALILVAVPRWRRTFGPLVLAGLVASAIAAFVARATGQELAEQIGITQDHREWGDRLVPISLILLVAFAAWWFRARNGARSGLTTLAAVVTVVAALGAIGATIVTGHSGAEAAWSDALEPAAAQPEPAPAASGAAAITLDEVAAHASADDCWSAIDGNVYDLTTWIGAHPGGADAILGLCGTDGTAAFTAQHGGQGAPEQELASLLVGPLAP